MTQDANNTAGTSDKIKSILERGISEAGGLLPVLQAVQEELGYIPPESIPDFATAFNLSRAEVHGVITFYHDFRTTPPARHTIRICRAEACQSMGADQLLEHAEKTLGCRLHEKTSDGVFSLEPVYCLGHCACSPAIMVDNTMHARVSPAQFDQLIEKAKETT